MHWRWNTHPQLQSALQAMLVPKRPSQSTSTGSVQAILDLPSLTATTTNPVDFHFAKFDLTFNLRERGNAAGLGGMIEYATDLFDAAIARWPSIYGVAEAIVLSPTNRCCTCRCSRKPSTIVDHEWNDTAVDFGPPPDHPCPL
ncbi:MAG: hypothetical protein R3E79_00245 [Caldilineaceae bacterium]